jgi:hypothetical protein
MPIVSLSLLALPNQFAPLLRGQPVVPSAHKDPFDRQFRLLGLQGLRSMMVSGLGMASWEVPGRHR